MTCDDYQQLAPFKNCQYKQLKQLYPILAVGRVDSRVVIALSLALDDNKAIILAESNGLFHKIGEKASKKPIDLDGLYKLIRHLNH